MTQVALMYHWEYEKYDFGPAHPMKPWRWRLAWDLIKTLGLIDGGAVSTVKPSSASRQHLLLFHTPEYVDLVTKQSAEGFGFLDTGDTPAFQGCLEAASLSVGGTLKAADLVMGGEVKVAFNPCGGFHHAHANRASGFCIFNDVAVCLAYLTAQHGVDRIVYLDIDAHHGDGVMYGFYDSSSVLDIDFHESGAYLFPGTGSTAEIGAGEGSGLKVNVPLPPRTTDEAFIKAFDYLVPRLMRAYEPEVVVLQSGTDGHHEDRLAHLALTTRSYVHVARTVKQLTEELCDGKLIVTGGGGYNTMNVARCWTLELAEFAGARVPNNIPKEWLNLCLTLEGTTPTAVLRDDETVAPSLSRPSVVGDVQRTVREVERLVSSRLNFQR